MLSLWKGECKGLKADRSVTALKGRVNSVQCAAKRSVGKKGIASRRRAVNSIVNCQWSIVMPGTRNPNATLCHSERSEESRGEKEEILRFALNDKVIVNCQWLIVMRGTRRIMYLENNH